MTERLLAGKTALITGATSSIAVESASGLEEAAHQLYLDDGAELRRGWAE